MLSLLNNLFRSAVRTFGFFAKEMTGVLRQPLLIISLVLGPFVILLLFGVGFRGQHPEFRTTLVVPNDPSISDKPEDYRDGFSEVFQLQEVTRDQVHAQARLQSRETDVVVVVPPDVSQQILSGRPARLPIFYTETDPTQAAWVRYFAHVQTSELNRQILAEVLRHSKGPAAQAVEQAQQTRDEIDALDADIRSGDYATAAVRVAQLFVAVQAARAGLAQGLDAVETAGTEPAANADGEATTSLLAMERELLGLQDDLRRGPAGQASAQQRVQALRNANDRFSALVQRINNVPADTLVSPFTADARNVLPVEPSAIAFYTPAVIALLLQHIGVTLSALSSVRDRLLGTLELFRVSPVGAGNILMGKSLGYALVLGFVGLALTAAATSFLRVPWVGNPFFYWLSIGLTIFASLGLGFAISVIANTESQAVQLSMLALLTSVFFGGFFLPLEQLFPWVWAVSYVLPVTYGAIDLRDVMLRGVAPSWPFLVGPLVLGSVFFVLATLGLRRQMRRA
jgi:ABC-2 type transport system permease protein